jgi:quercetin dioxygenase-like cupin family protein
MMTANSKPGNMIPSQVTRLSELVAVANSAIVSRVLLRTAGGNVTLFAFDSGQELAEHTAPFDALVCVLEGGLELTIGGEAYSVTSGESILMPADVPHALKATTKSKMMLVMLREKKTE